MSDAGMLSAVFVAVMAAFYLMFIRPVHKDQIKHRKQMRELRPGDEVLTTSNFIAKVLDIQVPETGPTRISLELADGVVFTALPQAILQRLTTDEARESDPGHATSASAPSGSGRAST